MVQCSVVACKLMCGCTYCTHVRILARSPSSLALTILHTLMQGESLWLHLDIIKSLAAMCHEVFVGGTVQYAYTTIPTYPRWGAQTAVYDPCLQ